MSFNYIGSKASLSVFLSTSLQEYIVKHKIVLSEECVLGDLFTGTSIVPTILASVIPFKRLITNDTQMYAKIASDGKYLPGDVLPPSETFSGSKEGFITREYSGEKMYFTRENAIRIDYIREKIDKLPEPVRSVYLYALLASADAVANTASVYGAYLKSYKTSAQKPLPFEKTLQQIIKDRAEKFAKFDGYVGYQSDILELVPWIHMDVCYLDPPYNHRQYSSNYHILETIALGDSPEIKGKTGLRVDGYSSPFCSKVKAKPAFFELFNAINTTVIMVSYSTDGILSENEMIGCLSDKYRDITVKRQGYKKFNSHAGTSASDIEELLFIARRK